MNRHRQPRRSRQRGAILITSLILLLVLTLISISGMNLSFLENLMATNTQFQTTSLANAERALRAGEQDVQTKVNLELGDDDHYHESGDIDPSLATWSFDIFIYATSNGSNYAIEYLKPISRLGGACSGKMFGSSPLCTIYPFRVNAHNVSGKGATRNVQTIYVTTTAP